MNLLSNPSFEGGWIDLLPYGGRLTNQCPADYNLNVRLPGTRLISADSYDGPDDAPVYDTVAVVPECIHKLRAQLPDAAELILEGDTVYKVFSATNPFSVDLIAQVLITRPGTLIPTVAVQVHNHGDGSLGAAVWRLLLNDYEGEWRTFGAGFEDRVWYWDDGPWMHVMPGQVITAILQMESRALGGIDFFTDAWSFEFTPDEAPTPIPDLEGPTPGGYPAAAIVVDYDIITSTERRDELYLIASDMGVMVGPSHDHVRAWPPGAETYTVTLWDIPEHRHDEFRAWYQERSPDIEVVFLNAAEIPEPVPGPDPVPDPMPGDELQYTLPSSNLVGLHMQNPKTGWVEYVRDARPTIYKSVSQLGMIVEAKQAFPEILTVYRRFTRDDGKWVYYPGGPQAGALAWLDGYSRDFEAQAQSEGITVEQVLSYVDVIEEVNEMIGTYDPDLGPSVEFNIAFADAVRARYGNMVNAGMLTIPVGNPGEDEILGLLPAARKAYEDGHYIGYHPYWTADREVSWLTAHWRELAGRWTVWDEVFRANGVYPRYYGGEMGIVYAPVAWWNMNSGRGWKSCGPFSDYIEDLQVWNRLCLEWNAQHGNRFIGGTIFCYTTSGQWNDFDWEPGDLLELTEAMRNA